MKARHAAEENRERAERGADPKDAARGRLVSDRQQFDPEGRRDGQCQRHRTKNHHQPEGATAKEPGESRAGQRCRNRHDNAGKAAADSQCQSHRQRESKEHRVQLCADAEVIGEQHLPQHAENTRHEPDEQNPPGSPAKCRHPVAQCSAFLSSNRRTSCSNALRRRGHE